MFVRGPLGPAVLNVAAVFRDLVVEAAAGGVVDVREPIDAIGAEFVGASVDGFDQGAADAAFSG
jgi:hypothetical protein